VTTTHEPDLRTPDPGRPEGEKKPSAPARSRGGGGGRLTPPWLPWLLLAPALVVVGALLVYPLFWVVSLAFQDFGLKELNQGGFYWTGFDNFREILTDPLLWKTALPNTVVFAFACVGLTVVVGTLVALLLHRLGPWGRGILTTAIMVAWAMPAVSGTYVWVYVFDTSDGVVMRLLSGLGMVDPDTTNWFTDRLSFYAIATLNVVHHGFPFVAVTVLAGLLTVPREVLESAEMDGAGPWRRFWHVTYPLMKPIFAVVVVLSTIWDFKVFTQIYLMPGGSGTNRKMLNLGTWSYLEGISQNRFGYGAAVAVVLTLLLLAITAVYLRTLFKQDEIS
jgi:N,N'-diacetylchitobiose transport system permease protein